MRLVGRNFYRKVRLILIASALGVCLVILARTQLPSDWSARLKRTAGTESAPKADKNWEWSRENLNQLMSLLDRQHRQHSAANASDAGFTAHPNSSRDYRMSFPSISKYLPFIVNEESALTPAFVMSRRSPNKKASIVFGVPHIRRSKESYLQLTLHFLISNLRAEDLNDTLIVVLIGETNLEYITDTSRMISNQFNEYVTSGVLEVISPSPDYYPDFNSTFTKETLGDPIKRVHWRTKQNLDFVYLMTYAHTRADYYVQLEDDVVSKPGFVGEIKECVSELSRNGTDWLAIRFCRLGFIGQMLKCADLPQLISFLLIFHSDQPSDWLLDDLIQVRACRKDKDANDCRTKKDSLWRTHHTSLFQHIGYHSSLDGKIQKLKDKFFKASQYSYFAHKDNPSARVTTTLNTYQNHHIQGAYDGSDFFWAIDPKKGDTISIAFAAEVALDFVAIQSGNLDHPSDKVMDNSTVEVLPSSAVNASLFPRMADGYYVVSLFADGFVKADNLNVFQRIKEVRITFHSDSPYWLILSEIHVKSL